MSRDVVVWAAMTILLLNLTNIAFKTTPLVSANPTTINETPKDSFAPNGYSELSIPPPMEWNKTYGTEYRDRAHSVVQTSDGGYALGGSIRYFDTWIDFLLVKTDSSGNMQWNKTYGGGGIYKDEQNYAYSLIQTSDGGYAIAGTKYTYAELGDAWLVKTDAPGNMLWNKTYDGTGDDWAYSVTQTMDGGYAIAGGTSSFGAGSGDFWLVKTDAYGNMLWNKTYGGTGDEEAHSVIQTSDGGYAMAGYTLSFGAGFYDFWLVKTDAYGNLEWSKTYGGVRWDEARSIVQTSDEGYTVAGDTESFGAGYADFWLVKTDAYGNMLWNKTYGGKAYDLAPHVVQTSDGGYAMAGYTYSLGAGNADFWLVKTDASGNFLWSQAFGGTHNDYAFSVIQTVDDGYALAGTTESFGAGDADFWLIKLAPTHLTATLHINPKGLNLWSRGKWITAYIELPNGYDVSGINISSILLNQAIAVDQKAPTEIGDYDSDGVPDLMIKFDRAEVVCHILAILDLPPRFKTITLTITGNLHDGTPFQGSCTIKTIHISPRIPRTNIFPI